jgi:hypothetical protein
MGQRVWSAPFRFGTPFRMGLAAQYASQPASEKSTLRAECLMVAISSTQTSPQEQKHRRDKDEFRSTWNEVVR